MAYSTELTAALTAATAGQLARWRKETKKDPAALVPEFGKVGGAWLYSFRDLIALRTFVYLRESTSMQMIRKSVGTLEQLGDRDHLSAYTLTRTTTPAGKTHDLQWVLDDGDTVSLVKRRGQMVMDRAPMAEIVGPFSVGRDGGRRRAPDLYQPNAYVSLDPEVRGGYPVITNTRVPFDTVAALIEDGYPAKAVPTIYPNVSPRAAKAAHQWWRSMERASRAA